MSGIRNLLENAEIEPMGQLFLHEFHYGSVILGHAP